MYTDNLKYTGNLNLYQMLWIAYFSLSVAIFNLFNVKTQDTVDKVQSFSLRHISLDRILGVLSQEGTPWVCFKRVIYLELSHCYFVLFCSVF